MVLPPIGGLNGRDGLANMPPEDAFVLDNWFPDLTTVNTRLGYTQFASLDSGAAIESIEVWAGGNETRMWIFAGGEVYALPPYATLPFPKVIPAGPGLFTGRNSNRASSAMFSNAGETIMVAVTGNDPPIGVGAPGGFLATLTITGLTGSQNLLHGVFGFKGRLYFAQKDQLGFYYLAVGAIQGAASYFDLNQQAKAGGYLLGIAGFSRDSGNGINDYIVFMTSRGEYIVYAGTDPSNAANWSLVARYKSSPPIGRKGWFNFRSDLYIISEEGIVSFAEIMSNGENGEDTKYLTSKLGKNLTDLVTFKNTHGWTTTTDPVHNQLIINVPASDTISGTYYQFVMNTSSNAWCRFKGINAICWAQFATALPTNANTQSYAVFGTNDGKIFIANSGYTDNGTAIVCDARQAPNYFADQYVSAATDKHFHFGTYVLESSITPAINVSLSVNFETEAPTFIQNMAGTGIENITVPFGKLGYVASTWLQTTISTGSVRWYASRVITENSDGIVLL